MKIIKSAVASMVVLMSLVAVQPVHAFCSPLRGCVPSPQHFFILQLPVMWPGDEDNAPNPIPAQGTIRVTDLAQNSTVGTGAFTLKNSAVKNGYWTDYNKLIQKMNIKTKDGTTVGTYLVAVTVNLPAEKFPAMTIPAATLTCTNTFKAKGDYGYYSSQINYDYSPAHTWTCVAQ